MRASTILAITPPRLDEFLSRLETHPRASDEVTPLLDALPR